MKFSTRLLSVTFITVLLSVAAFGQNERLTNSQIVEMTKVGLDASIIVMKIEESEPAFDLSADALIELRRNGVDNSVIAKMLEKKPAAALPTESRNASVSYSENTPATTTGKVPAAFNAAEALRTAKTVAIAKSSVNPSRQSLEKELMKRGDWQKYNLTLIRYKEEADIFIEIGRVPFSWITHRYVFRVYDRRTGTIITAGETTSWGSLAENMAREITQKLANVETQ